MECVSQQQTHQHKLCQFPSHPPHSSPPNLCSFLPNDHPFDVQNQRLPASAKTQRAATREFIKRGTGMNGWKGRECALPAAGPIHFQFHFLSTPMGPRGKGNQPTNSARPLTKWIPSRRGRMLTAAVSTHKSAEANRTRTVEA